MQRMPGLPELPRGQKILLDILGVDYVDVLLEARLKEVLDETDEDAIDDVEAEEEESVSETQPNSQPSETSSQI